MFRKIRTQGLAFTAISGVGFVFDITIFISLVSLLNVQLFLASFISSCSVACAIFVYSNRRIFNKSRTKIFSVMLYLSYQIVQIIVVSKLVEIITLMWAGSSGLAVATTGALIKAGLVPFTLFANFLASKLFSLFNPSTQKESV